MQVYIKNLKSVVDSFPAPISMNFQKMSLKSKILLGVCSQLLFLTAIKKIRNL